MRKKGADRNKLAVKHRGLVFRTLRRPLPYIGLLLAVLLLVFQQAIRDYTADIVGESLLNIVKNETGGNYTIQSSLVKFDIFTKELRIKDFEIQLDSTVISEEEYLQTHPNLVNISTPLLVLKIHSWFELIFSKDLRINFIGIQTPVVKLDKSDHYQRENDEISSIGPLTNIQNYLNSFEVDSFRIIDGYVEINSHKIDHVKEMDVKVNRFSSSLKNFRFGQESVVDVFAGLYADHIDLEIHDQELLLPDNEHILSFKRLWLSSQENEFLLDSLAITSNETSESGQPLNSFELDKFHISGLDFEHAYKHNELKVDSINIYNPVINVSKINSLIKSDDSSFEIGTFLNGIGINIINVYDAKVDVNTDYPIHFGNLNLRISDYHLDTLLVDRDFLLENLNDAKLAIEDVSIAMPDSIHNVSLESINLDVKDSTFAARDIRISPIAGRTNYNLLKSLQAPILQNTSIREVTMEGLNYNDLMVSSTVDIGQINITRPVSYLTHYSSIKGRPLTSNPIDHLKKIDGLSVINGFVQFNHIQRGKSIKTILESIDINGHNIVSMEETPADSLLVHTLHKLGLRYSNFDINVLEGSTQVQSMGHTVNFSNLKIEDNSDLYIGALTFQPDSADLPLNQFEVNATNIQVKGFDEESLTAYKALFVDSITIGQFSSIADFKYSQTSNTISQQLLDQVVIGYFGLGDGSLNVKNKNIAFTVDHIFGEAYHLELDSLSSSNKLKVDFNDIYLQHGRFNFINRKNNFRVYGTSGKLSEADSLIELNNVNIRDARKDLVGRAAHIKMIGLDKQMLQKNNFLKFKEVVVQTPKFDIKLTNDTTKTTAVITHRQLLDAVLSRLTGVDFDSLVVENGQLNLKNNKNRNILLAGINASISDYSLDSLSLPTDIFKPDQFKLSIQNLSTASETDTIEVKEINLDLNARNLYTGPLTVMLNIDINRFNIQAPSFEIGGFTPLNLLNNNYSLDYVRTFGARIQLVQQQTMDTTSEAKKSNYYQLINSIFNKSLKEKQLIQNIDSAKLDLNTLTNALDDQKSINEVIFENTALDSLDQQTDSVLVTNIEVISDSTNVLPDSTKTLQVIRQKSLITGLIRNIQIDNSIFDWAKNNDPNFPLRNTNFSINITNLELDSLDDITIGDNIEDITLTIMNHKVKLPDSLNTLGFEELTVSTGRQNIQARGISLVARVGKYDYAGKVGHQVTWQNLYGLDVSIDSIDIPAFLTDQAIIAHKLTVHRGQLRLFRDKEYPFPEDQRRGMPQDALRMVGQTLTIDSVQVDSLNVEYRERHQADRKEGFITIDNISARFGTITNDSAHLAFNDNIRATASCNLYNQGKLTAHFNFLMNDPDNKFYWDLKFTSMPANEFNNILEEAAYVSIASGRIKSITLNAEADNDYATGKMKFLYNDLKVSVIKRKNMKTSGLGPGLLSFFANTFVVKKNNPNARVFVRQGDMYYERDERKVVFDYLVKTALNGIISSIGASSNRKELKKIKKAGKKKQDEEKGKKKRKGKQKA